MGGVVLAVEDTSDAGRRGGVGGAAVVGDAPFARPVQRDEQHLPRTGEGVVERGGIVEIAAPKTNPAPRQIPGLAGDADTDAYLFGGNALEETFDDVAIEFPRGAQSRRS